ncbi:MAG TPA: diguanylate cyclase [Gammaproteobacteria bacterium]
MRQFPFSKKTVLQLISCLALPWFSCQVAASQPGDGLRFHHYSQEDGLAQNTVQAIAQDRRGFIWLGTDDGLHRFDGYEMTVYQARPGEPDGLQSDSVQALEADGNGNLWIGTYGGGVSRLVLAEGAFTHFRHEENNAQSLRSDFVFRLAINPDGRLWVLTDKGLDLLDPVTGKVTRFQNGESTGLLTKEIWSIFVDSQGTAWAGAVNGLFVFDPKSNRFTLFRAGDPRYAAFHGHTILALEETATGELLVSTRAGLHRLDAARELVAHFGPEAFGLAEGSDVQLGRLLATSGGEIWASSFGSGIYWWDGASARFRHYRHNPADRWSLSDDVVLALLEDRTGMVWFGTETGGVNTFNPATRAFRHFRHRKDNPDSLPNRVVWSVIEDRAGDLWIASDGGLSRLDREHGKYTHYLHDPEDEQSISSPFVYDVIEDAQGRIWAATLRGVNRLDAQGGRFRRYEFTEGVDNAYYANSVSFLLADGAAVWAGTAEGLFRLDPETGEHRRFMRDAAGDSANFFTAATPARAGGWWLGTENGVVRFDPASERFVESYTVADGLSHPFVIDLLETRDGTLWVATDYQLNRIRPDGGVEHIGVGEGLPNNTIYSLLEDEDGDLWIGTNNGLAEYDPVSGEVHVYFASDGLQANEFNAAARFRSSSGEMFFGGINGFTAFHPAAIRHDRKPPTVAITKFFKFNRQVPLETPVHALESLALSWRDSVIGFEFAAFDFAAPLKNRFRYRLEGFDRQWLETVGHNHVTYTNLDPGHYLLRVQGANRHGVWSRDEAQLVIEIAPPPWQTWWAYALYVLAALALLSAGLRFHFVRLAERHQLESAQQKRQWAETLHQLTQALAASLDGREVAEELLENLRTMVAFRKAVLFVEQGVEIHVAGAKGVRDERMKTLETMPAEYSRFFAEVRHGRKSRIVMRHDVQMPVLQDDMSPAAQFLAVPAYSRSDEFALLLIGRDAPPFSEQERDIVSAFLTQALVAIDNARLFAEVQNLATTDTLTQVSNRRYFFELAELEFARSKRYGRDVSLILLDADNFTAINDTYGREIGDRVLKIVANCCRNSLRHFDIIGRYGGEDFVIMLPETPMNVAADVADRLRKSIESVRLDTHKGELAVTVSVGVAVATENTPDLPALINRADMALYEAKRAGRNKVVVAEK